MRQDALYEELRRRNARIIDRVEELPRRMTPELSRRRPAPGKWSAAEILEHLCASDAGYLARMRPLVREARADGRQGGPGSRFWRPTLMGRLLVWGLSGRRPLPTVPALEPRGGGARGAESQRAYLELRREVDALLEASRELPWRRLRFTSPFSGLVRPNLGDGFRVLAVHAERHLDQIDRCLAARSGGA